MNKKNNRKGFTIVELVIVIAVIAVLATVLVPTFGNVIAKANNTALIQEIKNEHTNYVTHYADKEGYVDSLYIKIGTNYYHITDGEIDMLTSGDTGYDEKMDQPKAVTTGVTASASTVVFCAECDEIYTLPDGETDYVCGCTE